MLNLTIWCYPTSQSEFFEEEGIVFLSKVSSSSKLGKAAINTWLFLDCLATGCSSWQELHRRVWVLSLLTKCYYNCVCFRGRLASICWPGRKYSPWQPPPSHQVSLGHSLNSNHINWFVFHSTWRGWRWLSKYFVKGSTITGDSNFLWVRVHNNCFLVESYTTYIIIFTQVCVCRKQAACTHTCLNILVSLVVGLLVVSWKMLIYPR